MANQETHINITEDTDHASRKEELAQNRVFGAHRWWSRKKRVTMYTSGIM